MSDDRLSRALEELRAGAECALIDAEESLALAERAQRSAAVRRCREDVEAARAQLEVLDIAAWLTTGADNRLSWLVRGLEHAELLRTVELHAEGLTQKVMAKELDITQQAVAKRLRKARQMGLLKDEGE